MKSHVIISTNVERAFAYIQNVSFSITWLLSFETFSQWILIMSHPPTHSRSAFTPLLLHFHGLSFFALNLLSPICVAQLLLDVGPALDIVDWSRVTPLKKNSSFWSSGPPRCGCALFAFANVLCLLSRLLGVHRCALPVVSGKHCIFDIIYTTGSYNASALPQRSLSLGELCVRLRIPQSLILSSLTSCGSLCLSLSIIRSRFSDDSWEVHWSLG